MKPVMLKCGCASHATRTMPDGNKIPCCIFKVKEKDVRDFLKDTLEFESLRNLGKQLKVTASTLSRFANGKGISVANFLKLYNWMHQNTD